MTKDEDTFYFNVFWLMKIYSSSYLLVLLLHVCPILTCDKVLYFCAGALNYGCEYYLESKFYNINIAQEEYLQFSINLWSYVL